MFWIERAENVIKCLFKFLVEPKLQKYLIFLAIAIFQKKFQERKKTFACWNVLSAQIAFFSPDLPAQYFPLTCCLPWGLADWGWCRSYFWAPRNSPDLAWSKLSNIPWSLWWHCRDGCPSPQLWWWTWLTGGGLSDYHCEKIYSLKLFCLKSSQNVVLKRISEQNEISL